jgi:uncharacterized membrane protein YccC
VVDAPSRAGAARPLIRRAVEGARTAVSQLHLTDPDRAALKSAARAAIVIPAVFAIADELIGNPQTALFAAFGSFAILVLVDFAGPVRSRLTAYLVLACAGAANIVLGTLCSRNAWLAAGAMAIVGFGILFSGSINGYFAAAATSALLTFILPVTVQAPFSQVPARLAGWALAAGIGICAHMLLWPARPRATLRADAAIASDALADLADPEPSRDAAAVGRAREAVKSLRKGFLTAPYRPTGPTRRTMALASLVDELDWLLSFLAPKHASASLELCREENAEALAATASVLRASAATLRGRSERPDFGRLDRARDVLAEALARRIGEVPAALEDELLGSALEPTFRIRVISYSARQVAGYALLAAGIPAPEFDELDVAESPPRSARAVVRATERSAAEHAVGQSVWFRNSVRGAIGLAIAVYIAQRTGLQHSFWVVLGTLSVLRSNALSTGWSVVSALAGTAVGIVLGAVLILAIGTNEVVLWAVLPVAVLLAGYAPRAISFAAGQAGFTVVLFVLFNIIQPSGPGLGLVRIEDVAIGFGVSLGVGLLFWPRGAGALLRENLASAYERSAEYVVAKARLIAGESDRGEPAGQAQAAAAAVHRLDGAFRQYLTERSAQRVDVETLGALVAGAARVRRTGQSLAALGSMTDPDAALARCGRNLDGELEALQSWYGALGDSFAHFSEVPPPHVRDPASSKRLLDCVRATVADGDGDGTKLRSALVLVWANQHLDNLWRLESHLRGTRV